MHEMLTFVYSGRSPNLTEMAAELLAVADRFALVGLKDMADQVRDFSIDFFYRIFGIRPISGDFLE